MGGGDDEISVDRGIDTEDRCEDNARDVLNLNRDEGKRFSSCSMSSTEDDDGCVDEDTIKRDNKNGSGQNVAATTPETATSPPPPDVIMHHNCNDNATKRKGSRRGRRKRRSFNAAAEPTDATAIISNDHSGDVRSTAPDVTDVGEDKRDDDDDEEISNVCDHGVAHTDSTSNTLSNTTGDNDCVVNADINTNNGDQSTNATPQSEQVNERNEN